MLPIDSLAHLSLVLNATMPEEIPKKKDSLDFVEGLPQRIPVKYKEDAEQTVPVEPAKKEESDGEKTEEGE